MIKNIVKHNRPIATVLKEYLERKRGKVAEARNELHRRFCYLDWNVQKKVIIAHLQGSRSEREWVYPRLLNYWDKSFMPVVKTVWETYREDECAWSVIRYFPKEYIFTNTALLSQSRNYYFICIRFANDKDFKIDKTKLSAFDYLSLCQKKAIHIESEEALASLFEVVIDCVLNYKEQYLNVPSLETISPLFFPTIRKAVWFVESLEDKTVINLFKDWCAEVAVISNKEWETLSRSCPSYILKNVYASRIILRNMGVMLSESILNRFININPNLKELIEKLELRVNFDHIVKELFYE